MTNSFGSIPNPLNNKRQRVSSANGPVIIQASPSFCSPLLQQTKEWKGLEQTMEENGGNEMELKQVFE